jgi:multidrug efflux system membrane fusion protein
MRETAYSLAMPSYRSRMELLLTHLSTVHSLGRPWRVATLLAALTVTLLSACGESQSASVGRPPPTVSVAGVLIKHVRPMGEFNGRIEAADSVELRPRVSGYIERIEFVEGQEVKRGDVLFVIDDRSYRAELSRATAELAQTSAQAELAHGEAARAQTLVQQQAISTEIWEQRRAASERANAEVQAAQAAVEQARLSLDWTRVRAPIAGRAGRALVTPGNLVTANDSASVLTTLVTLNPMHVHFEADEAILLRFIDAQRNSALPVRVGLVGEAGFAHEGRVNFLDNRVSRQTGTIGLRAVLENAERRLLPGLFARVQLPISEPVDAMLIDERAVLTDQDRKYVFVVDADGIAVRRDVLLGGTVEGLRIVQAGLVATDRVVVEGVRRIMRPGIPVVAQEVDMASRAAPVGGNVSPAERTR